MRGVLALSSIGLALLIGSFLAGDPAAVGDAIGRLVAPVSVAFLLVLASVGVGDLARSLANRLLAEKRQPADPAFHLVVGYPLLGGLLFLLGLVSTVSMVIVPAAVLAALFGVRALGRKRSGKQERLRIGVLPAILLGATVLITILLASVPAVALDEVAYHLAIPHLWVTTGRAVSLPLMSHSFFPLGTESVDLVSLALLGHAGSIASHFLHLAVGVAGAIVLLRWLQQRGASHGAIGVAAIVSTPAMFVGAGWSGTDVPLVATTVALFVAIDDFLREERAGGRIAAALASGLLIKYTFMPLALILITIAWLRTSRRSLLARAVLIGAVAGSLFLVRNVLLTGNPVEPFLTGETAEIERFRWRGSIGSTLSSYLLYGLSVDDSVGLLLPALALAALASWKMIEERWLRVAASSFVAATILLLFLAPAGRILLPFLVIPAMIALPAIEAGTGVKGRWMIGGVLVAGTVFQLVMSVPFLRRVDPLPVVLGQVEEERWLAGKRTTQAFIREGNAVLPPDGRTLILGINELFWFEGDVRGGGNFDSQRFVSFFSNENFRERLEEEGITHVLVYPTWIVIEHETDDPRIRQRMLVLTWQASENLRRFLQEETVIVEVTENTGLHRIGK